MPRVAGQIDQAKAEAILLAAAEAFAERGLAVSLEEIARRAGVSKQTVYNRYGDKKALVRALVQQRVEGITAPLNAADADAPPQEALSAFARTLLSVVASKSQMLFRTIVQSAGEMPEVAQEMFETGPRQSKARLADYLARQTAAGRLAVDDPAQAAEFFTGMVVGQRQMRVLLGQALAMDEAQVAAVAEEAARRFVRAYAP